MEVADSVKSISAEEESSQEIVGVDNTKGGERLPDNRTFWSVSDPSSRTP